MVEFMKGSTHGVIDNTMRGHFGATKTLELSS